MLIQEIIKEHLDVITLFIDDKENGILSIF